MCQIQRTPNLDMQRTLWKRRKEIITEVTSVANNQPVFKTPWEKKQNFIDNLVEKILPNTNFEQLPKQRLRMVCRQ